MTTCAALIVAAGRGRRFGGDLPKQYSRLGGAPVLRHTLRRFAEHPRIATVRTVIHPDDRPLYDQAAAGLKVGDPVAGGAERQDSVRAGLEALALEAPDRVLIHDGARPFVPAGVIDRVIDALDVSPGALAAVAIADTVKTAADGRCCGTVDRAGLWRAQTPQGFRFADILEAHRAAAGQALTDDTAVAEAAGLEIALVAGAEENFKITTQDDLQRAERWVSGGLAEYRTGCGFDVHAFGDGTSVVLCGVPIAHDRGLKGHSDADVGLHALTDALLASIGAGDIGEHFPPADERWRGAPSDLFLRHAARMVAARGGRIANVDVTLVCERPKIAPHRVRMVARIAEILDVEPGRVSVKATTTERLGFTGRGEGLAAQAVATVRLPLMSDEA